MKDIRYKVSNSARSARKSIEGSNLVLFFSLPFKPAGRRNLSATTQPWGLKGVVYQAYDPRLLRTDFLFSVMPLEDWLLGAGGLWVERDPESAQFRHVCLYQTCKAGELWCIAQASPYADRQSRC